MSRLDLSCPIFFEIYSCVVDFIISVTTHTTRTRTRTRACSSVKTHEFALECMFNAIDENQDKKITKAEIFEVLKQDRRKRMPLVDNERQTLEEIYNTWDGERQMEIPELAKRFEKTFFWMQQANSMITALKTEHTEVQQQEQRSGGRAEDDSKAVPSNAEQMDRHLIKVSKEIEPRIQEQREQTNGFIKMLRSALSDSSSAHENSKNFYKFYDDEKRVTRSYKRMATVCFFVGSAMLVFAIAIYAYLRFEKEESNTTAAAVFTSIIALILPAGAFLFWDYAKRGIVGASGIIDDSPTSFLANARTLVGCTDPLRREIGAPHQCPLGVGSKLPLSLYADVSTFRCRITTT